MRKYSKDLKQALTIRLNQKTYTWLCQIATEYHMSIGDIIRMALVKFIKEYFGEDINEN